MMSLKFEQKITVKNGTGQNPKIFNSVAMDILQNIFDFL